MKRLFLILTSLLLLFSCNDATIDVSTLEEGETGSVRIYAGVNSRTLLPDTPNPAKYKVVLTNDVNNYESEFVFGSDIYFDSVKVGTYQIHVDALNQDGAVIYNGDSEITIKPNELSQAVVNLSYILSGTGSIELKISWKTDATNNGPFYDAIKNNSLGFKAYKIVENEDKTGKSEVALSGKEIQYVSDVSSGEYLYTEDGLAATSGTDVIFYIYTKLNGVNTIIAKTFATTILVYQNHVSKPDQNEIYNFKLDQNNMISYLKNVKNASYSLSDINTKNNLVISWANPVLPDSQYPISVDVTLTNNNDNSSRTERIDNITKDQANSTHEFEGFSPEYSYSVSFKVVGQLGYSNTKTLISDARTKVSVDSISFSNTFAESYVQGDSVEIGVAFEPVDATFKDYTIAATESATVSGNTVTFNKYGDYDITITATDNTNATATHSTTVKLPAPTGYSVQAKENGIELNWNSVANATEYVIEKTSGETKETINVPDTSYLDSDVYSNTEYTYSVKAVVAEDKYSSASVDATIKTEIAQIEITLPSLDQTSLAEAFGQINGHFVDISDESSKLTISIAEIAGATNYKWMIGSDSRIIAESATYDPSVEMITIDSSTIGETSSYEESIPLKLEFVVGGKTYSATAYIWAIDGNPGEISLSDINNDNRVVYDVPEQIAVSFSNSNIDYTPAITWTSSDSSIASVDENGVVTSHLTGDVDITATINSTQRSATIHIQSYIPATAISLNLGQNTLILEKNGVEIINSSYKSTSITPVVTAANGIKATSNVSFRSSNTAIAVVDENGVVSPVSAGDVEIIGVIDGIESKQTLHVLDFKIVYGGEDITGKSKQFTGRPSGNDYNINLETSNSSKTGDDLINEGYSVKWCFDGNESNIEEGSWTTSVKINGNGFNATFTRESNASRPKVTAIIKDKDNNQIGVVSFTATP